MIALRRRCDTRRQDELEPTSCLLSPPRLTPSFPFPILPEATEQIPKLAGSRVSLDPSTPRQDPTQAKHSNLLQDKSLP